MAVKVLLIYLIFINLAAFCLMWADKRRAEKRLWRIPERSLFLSAALGGSAGVLAGMYLFRHKTKHPSFVLGIPLILAVQTGAGVLAYLNLIR